MTDPTEKINYALSLVDGATPGPWLVGEPMNGPQLAEMVTYCNGMLAPVRRRFDYGDADNAEIDRRILKDAEQIALSPLIPAALRLALALLEEYEDYGPTAVETPLLAFLSLLPEPKKGATE